MNEQQGMERFVKATERIAAALEQMAKQQAEFLATMPSEEVRVEPEPEPAPEPETLTVDADKHALGCSARTGEFKDCTCGADARGEARHFYNATCPCPTCWAERQRLRRAEATGLQEAHDANCGCLGCHAERGIRRSP